MRTSIRTAPLGMALGVLAGVSVPVSKVVCPS